jgi:hypothetical protein
VTTIAPPPPAPPAPSQLSPGGRSALRAAFVVAAVMLIGGSVIALSVTAFGLSRFRVIADEQPLPADLRSLVVDTADVPAAVTLTTDRDATEPRVTMRMINSAGTGDQTLAVDRQGGRATVTVNGAVPEFMRWSRAGQITVTLPPALARGMSVTVRQEAGVLFAQADLDELVAHGTEGAVVLSGSARRIEVHNENGDVVTREPISVAESFTAETVDGDVIVDFRDAAPRTVEASTGNGDVALGLPTPGPYLVRAVSGSDTSVRVPETTDADRAAAEVTARSGDGAVTVSTLNGDRADRFRPDR